jgi:Delta7-sterol 5-desaturase
MQKLPDFSSPLGFLILSGLFFLVVTGRYLLIAGIFYGVFYKWFPEKWQYRKINNRNYKKQQFKKEVSWSMTTALIFSIAGALTVVLWQQGFTKVYLNINEYGWWYLPVSLFISMFLHETYYYWVHRWMHRPAVFRLVHKVHHDSNITSPFTAFSFHPLEGLLQAIVLPITLIILPMHPSVILIQLTIMTFSSVINHLDIEIYPQGFNRHFIGRWLIGATHHSLHHKQFRYNYGLYFTFWDKIRKTESPFFSSLFKEKTGSGEA